MRRKDIRQVPDTQEVFLYPDSGVSVIIEILQRVEPDDLTEAAKFHFDSLAHDNSAASATVKSIEQVPNERKDETPTATTLVGVQQIAKFNRSDEDTVEILLVLYRVQSKNIDLVLTFNVPGAAQDGEAVGEAGRNSALRDFTTAVKSLKIVDFGLFA